MLLGTTNLKRVTNGPFATADFAEHASTSGFMCGIVASKALPILSKRALFKISVCDEVCLEFCRTIAQPKKASHPSCIES